MRVGYDLYDIYTSFLFSCLARLGRLSSGFDLFASPCLPLSLPSPLPISLLSTPAPLISPTIASSRGSALRNEPSENIWMKKQESRRVSNRIEVSSVLRLTPTHFAPALSSTLTTTTTTTTSALSSHVLFLPSANPYPPHRLQPRLHSRRGLHRSPSAGSGSLRRRRQSEEGG